jgi:hypothetical protein
MIELLPSKSKTLCSNQAARKEGRKGWKEGKEF